MKKIVWLLAVTMILTAISSVGLAAKPSRDPAAIANDLLDRLQTAYVAKNYTSITSFYENPVIEVDVTRNIHQFLSAEEFQAGLKKDMDPLTGIKLEFTERQISSEKDIILVHTVRIASAEGLPVIVKVELFMVIKRSYINKTSSNYVITEQTLLSEEYIPVNKPESGSEQSK